MVAVVPSTSLESGRYSKPWFYRSVFKRPLDILLVLLGAPFVLPLIVVLAVLVMRDGGNPFYSQERVGRDGKTYRMWKLRSMVVDADRRLSAYLEQNPEAKREWDETQKLRDDPRVTRFGRVLRRSSLDELPQLWNVLKGEMSLVGPRPMLPEQQSMYEGDGYYALRPGITGFWQTAGRNATSFSARAKYDDVYEQDLSFKSDLAILLRTFGVVMRGTGC
ncbi:Sugar transferase involved in LPS biosynthesis (colanic, teichoic acid) [Paracoccus seriniphilus]|uniref:Sugar transferase involved in LPS biosynthesis (Colanic, teichoic acid) n=2 Tax=Paracoccus seriniphilus TaxID=184748 RepID=A0A239PMJ9_9RHOB|nr:Sugar transferase involved in LPS biosynthesis (colanic, teichoic acid) [Paracoccus seriniphilus]